MEGINIKITGDSSQALREFKKLKEAAQQIVNIKMKPMLDWNSQWNFDISKIKLPQNIGQDFAQKLAEGISGLDSAGKSLEATFGGIFKTITASATAVTGLIGKVVKDSLSIGGGFEAQMTSAKVISGATAEEFEKLTAKAREMGATLPITAAQAAQAMTIMAQRGTNVTDILTSVEEVSSLAISQGVDLATAADILGSTLKNFGLAAEETGRIANEFNIASNTSALNISKLVEAMKYVAPAASAVGASVEEALSALMALSDAGLPGEMSGTGLAMVYTKLATKARIMGVETKTLEGKMKPLREVFTELRAKGFGLAEATQVFGQRGAKAALNLAKFSETLEYHEKDLQRVGVTQAAVQEKMKTWPNVWNAFQSASEELHIEIFEQIKTQSKEVVSSFADLTRALSKWVNETQIAGKSLDAFLEGLGLKIPSADEFRKILNGLNIQDFIDKAKSFGETIKNIGESIVTFFNSVKTPLLFLIEHLGTFASISFWGWIIGKGLQIPAAILGIAGAFDKLSKSVGALVGLNLTGLTGLFATIAAGGMVAGTAVVAKTIENFASHEERITAFRDKIEHEADELNRNVVEKITKGFKTGFEELPLEFDRVSPVLRKSLNNTIAKFQDEFKNKFAQAFIEINPDKALKKIEEKGFDTKTLQEQGTAIKLIAADISDDLGVTLTNALNNNQAAYESLEPEIKKVIDFMKESGVTARTTAEDFNNLLASFINIGKLKIAAENVVPINETQALRKRIFTPIDDLLSELPKNIEKAQNLLGKQNLNIVLNAEITTAQTQLEKLIKNISKDNNIPIKVVTAEALNQLKTLGAQGNKVAQSLVNNWKESGSAIDTFISNAKDAVDYLGVSPDKFLPALAKMTKGIQRIDPLTGKITEQFKKAHNALKEWANTSFDKLTQRLQRLRKAYEGGFIDKKSLETEIRNVSPQIKAQVVTELEPLKGQFKSTTDYYSVAASEYISKIQDIFGDLGVEMAQKEFSNLWSKTGSAIGQTITSQVERNMQVKNLEQPSLDFNMQGFSQALTPIAYKIEQIANQNQGVNNAFDYSASFNIVVNEIKNAAIDIQNVRAAINNLDNTVKSLQIPAQSQNEVDTTALVNEIKVISSGIQNLYTAFGNFESVMKPQTASTIDDSRIISALQEVQSAVLNVENALKSLTGGNTYDIDINQQGFVVQQKSDADNLARSTVSALRAGIGNGGI